MQNITFESLKKTHGDKAAATFNEISRLGGFGIQAPTSDFNAHDGGLAVNDQTPNIDKIKSLLASPARSDDNKKEGK